MAKCAQNTERNSLPRDLKKAKQKTLDGNFSVSLEMSFGGLLLFSRMVQFPLHKLVIFPWLLSLDCRLGGGWVLHMNIDVTFMAKLRSKALRYTLVFDARNKDNQQPLSLLLSLVFTISHFMCCQQPFLP